MITKIETLEIDPEVNAVLDRLLSFPESSSIPESVEFDEEVVFDDGNRMAIQVINDSEPWKFSAWAQGVLFSPEGCELACTEVLESLGDEVVIEHNGIEYITKIEVEFLEEEQSGMTIIIDGENYEVEEVSTTGYHKVAQIDISSNWQFIVAENSEIAGEAAREYWEDLAQQDTSEFVAVVGEDTLVQWALGNSAGPGSTHVNNLNDWLDLWLDIPEEHWASYDSIERDVTFCSEDLAEELDFVPGVAYRC